MSARQHFQDYLVKDPAEFERIVGYVPSIDVKEEEFAGVLSHHGFKRTAKCSIGACGTNYLEGYLVRWKSGRISNIGHCCAEHYLGEGFVLGLNKYRQEILLPHLRAALVTHKASLKGARAQLEVLHSRARDTASKKSALRRHYRQLFDFLHDHPGDEVIVYEPYWVEENFIDGHGQERTRRVRKERRAGVIRGLSGLREGVMAIAMEIDTSISEVEKVPVGSLSFRDLSRAVTAGERILPLFARASTLIRNADYLFSEDVEPLIQKLNATKSIEEQAKRYSLASLKKLI